ncbi:MAG TPA: sodium:solute symporter [Candidatus Ozemobacteraceae bacterium]|nr:sodium:solute symporter [Candidatus Ozemobacteraceae bacterium]
MGHSSIVFIGLSLYVAVTLYLTVRGMRRTKDLSSFTVGTGDIGPVWIGLSLTAQLTSVATFVVNPGLVYNYGLSALLGYGLAAGAGIMLGLVILSNRFRMVGSKVKALTIPQWIGARYESTGLRVFFALLSLSLMSFIVLIAVALALTLGSLLQVQGVSALSWLVVAVMVFVFSYTLIGGANTSTYTNALQAVIMLVVALILIGSGLPLLWKEGGLLAAIGNIDPQLTGLTNPASLYFRNVFEVFVCNFLVGLAIVCQPHILAKSLMLKNDIQVKKYLATAVVAGTVFLSVLVVGLYARATLTQVVTMDKVVPSYIAANFSSPVQVLIAIGLLCAGISTLEGLLLALSAIFSSDLYLALRTPVPGEDPETVSRRALAFGRTALVIAGIASVGMAWYQLRNPTGGSVAIFAQYGVYLLFTATFLPICCGLFFPKASRWLVTTGIIASVFGYALPATARAMGVDASILTLANNPAVLATFGILAGWTVVGLGLLVPEPQGELAPAPTAE